MTTPTNTAVEIDSDAGETRVRLPVVVIEGADTTDGRFLTPGGLTHRALPISLLACPASAHGGQEPDAAQIIGRIDSLTRHHGPDVVSPRTGEPFGDDVFVWSGEGVIDSAHPIADLVRRRYLRGVSVDLSGMDVELLGDDEAMADTENPRRRMIAHSAEISAVTLVPLAAFSDAYIELADDPAPVEPITADELPDGLIASAVPAWRSAEVGDYPALTAAGDELHTGGMIALVPADPATLAVDDGTPADELHLTLAYLGDDVTDWPEESRTALLAGMEQVAATMAAVEAEVMGHALFNPTGAHDREPCAVHLVSGTGLAEAKAAVADHDKSEHPIFIPHITAGFGVEVSALSYVGPVVFDKLRVALGEDVTDYPLMAGAEDVEAAPDADVDEVVTAAADASSPDLPDDGTAPVDEVGMPDAPQPCEAVGTDTYESEVGDHSAVRSLLYDERKQYAATCDEHDEWARGHIADLGFEVEEVVQIKQPAEQGDNEEISA